MEVDLYRRAVGVDAVEDQQRGVAVVVELGALAELLGVLDRQRMQAEALAELGELLVGAPFELEPKNSPCSRREGICGSSIS